MSNAPQECDLPGCTPWVLIPLLACILAPLVRPAMCIFAAGIIWTAYLAGLTPEPPPSPATWMWQ